MLGLAVLLSAFNIVRLAQLTYLNAYRPDWFSVVHEQIVPVVLLVFSVGLYLAWVRLAGRPLRVRSVLQWAVRLVVTYGVMLAVWWVCAPAYLSVLARTVEAFDVIRHGPRMLRLVVAPWHGLVASGDWADPLPIPQTVLGADLALAVALIVASSRALWARRGALALIGISVVAVGHVATIVAQIALMRTGTAENAAMRVVWELWVTLYQATGLPIAAWLTVCGSTLIETITPRGVVTVKRTPRGQPATRS